MKSIKEKAEENCIKYGNLGNVAYQEFEAGANYVLEQLEEFLNLYGVYCITSSARTYLMEMIKQLKK